jgi:ribonuclease HI
LHAKVHDTRKKDIERVKESVPEQLQMITCETNDIIYEIHDEVKYATVYTDGSLFDPNSQHFARSGWGLYVNTDQAANVARPLDTPHHCVFRAELRAILHAIQVCTIPTIVRSDCKSACELAALATNEGKYDSKHADADILSRMAEIGNTECWIKWMPAHLDEEKNIVKGRPSLKLVAPCYI